MVSLNEHCGGMRYRRSIEWTNISYINNNNSNTTTTTNGIYSYETIEYDEEASACSPVYFILDIFHLYYIPFIISIGLVGNLLSCIVFLNTHLKMRSSSYYLAALATADFGFLIALLFVWLNSQIGWQVFNEDGWCEILVYISAVCSSLSVWLIVAFTVERFIAVQYPLHRPHMCTTKRAKTIVVVLIGLSLICHSYAFFTAGVVHHQGDNDSGTCDLKPQHLEAMRIISIIDTIVSLIFPLILIVVMNTMITRNLFKFSRRFKSTTSDNGVTISNQFPSRDRSDINLNQIPSGSSSNNGIKLGSIGTGRRAGSQQSFHSSKNNHSSHNSSGSVAGIPAITVTPIVPVVPSSSSTAAPRNIAYQIPESTSRCIHIRSSSRNPVSTRNQQSITKMLLLISTVFILLNLPSYVIRLWVFFFTLARKDRPASLWCLQQFFMLLYYTNFSINFLLYAMCGITFRRCLQQLLRKNLKKITRYIGRRRRDSESS